MDLNTLLGNIKKNEDKIVSKKKEYKKDERFWKLELKFGSDGLKRGSAKVRFLSPVVPELEKPYVEITKYWIKGFGPRPYVENSRRSISPDEIDPVYELAGKLYKTEQEPWVGYAKRMSPSYKKLANILVIDDQNNPENNGKVMIYEMPSTVWKKIEKSLEPQDAFSEMVNPFHPIEGADFVVSAVVKSKDDGGNGFPDYDGSKFLSPAAMSGGDKDKIMEVLKSQPDLREFIAEDQFKSYNELKTNLRNIVGSDIPDEFFGGSQTVDKTTTSEAQAETSEDDCPAFEPDQNEGSKSLDAVPSTQESEEVDADVDDFLKQMQAEMDATAA